MTATTAQPTWNQQFTSPATEFPPTPLPILSGKIPSGLRGSLYRNGPGRLARGGHRVGHWFDGDGAILGVHFSEKGNRGLSLCSNRRLSRGRTKKPFYLWWLWNETFGKPLGTFS